MLYTYSMAVITEGYTLSAVTELTGAKRWAVENFCRQGVVPLVGPRGTGNHRKFDFAAVVQIALAERLSSALDVPAIAFVLAQLRTGQVWERLRDPLRRAEVALLRIRFRSPIDSAVAWADGFGGSDTLSGELRGQQWNIEPLALPIDRAIARVVDGRDDAACVFINLAALLAQLEVRTGDSL